jgi:hypothetical protein
MVIKERIIDLVVTFQTVVAVIRAGGVKRRKGKSRSYYFKLPPVNTARSIPRYFQPWIVRRIGRLTGLLAAGSRNICFYRSYAVVSVLRRWGIPLELNIGLGSLEASRKTEGHCWVTLHGEKFFEHTSPEETYPIEIGRNESGIRYWAGAGGGENAKPDGSGRWASSFRVPRYLKTQPRPLRILLERFLGRKAQ